MDGGEKKEVRRPMNAFLIFCKRHRGFVREKNPDMDNRSVTRVLGDLWANLGEEKKIYTNLAKQYKDAFMKANPNYKWHSADKSQSSSAKMVSKPTNSRVIKSVAEIHTDGSIIPGKLADPEKMGGLNLLLMADKETCAPLASSVPLTLNRTLAVPHSVLPGHASASAADQSTVSASALLQLAEMCTSELQGCNDNKHQPNSQTLPALPPSIPLSGLTCAPQQPMPPPKKRVRHWSLSEADSVYDACSDNNREQASGSLSPQNASVQKTRCTSLGSALFSAERYSSVNTYKVYPSRRKLSSSATESIPSPTGPLEDGMDDTDSPVFSPDANRPENLSGESKLDSHDHFDYLPQNLSGFASRSPTLVPKTPVHIPSFDQKDQPACQKVVNTLTPSPVTVSLQQPLNILTGASGSVVSTTPDYHLPNKSHHRMPLSMYSDPTSKTYGSQEADAKSENGNNSFSTWREQDKRRTKSEELLPEALNLHMSSGYTDEACPPPARLIHLDEKHMKYKSPHHDMTRFDPKCDIKTSSAAASLPVDLSFVASSGSVVKASSTSTLSKGRIASILNNSNVSREMFHVDASNYHSASETLSKINNEAKKAVRISAEKSEPISYQASEQSSPLPIFTSAGTNNSIIRLQPGFKVLEAQGSNLSINNPQTFREVKLKKKWTERMLIETKLQDLTQQTESSGGHSLPNDALHVGSRSDVGADVYQHGLPSESQPVRCHLKNYSGGAVSGNNETTLLKMPTSYDIPSLQALLILNQPSGLSESMQNHAHGPSSFSASGSSHTKLMLQLAQNQQTDRQGEAKFRSVYDESGIKSEPGAVDFTRLYQDYKCVSGNQHGQTTHKKEFDGRGIKNRPEESICNEGSIKNRNVDSTSKDCPVKSEDFSQKQVLNEIAACGKKFMDHIVEQLCKSDFSPGEHPGNASDRSLEGGDGRGSSPHLSDVKLELGDEVESVNRGLKEELPMEWLKKEEHRNSSVLEKPRSVGKVENAISSPLAQLDPAVEDNSLHSTSTNTNLPSQHEVVGDPEDNFRKRETYVQAPGNLSAESRFQNQCSTVTPESCEQSDVSEDPSLQPVRKSRRANRGQKYQELIKEGFIQPSRERMAARNAERGGRSFGTREEFEKMEIKRTLKRSASEKDMPSDGAVVFSSNATGSATSDSTPDKRFTSGDFDLEKEIESLPVCSLDQLDKKKVAKRRCEGDITGLPPPHRNNGDAVSTLLRAPACTTHSKLGGSVPKFDDLSEPCCLAPHIPLPKEERPTEPVTGSRKRKARKHCIMRISLLEKTPLAEVAVEKCTKSLPSACPEKKLARDAHCDDDNVSSSVNSWGASESTGLVSSMAFKVETDDDDTRMNMAAENCQLDRSDSTFACVLSVPQTVIIGKGRTVSPASMLSLRTVSDNFASPPSSSSSSSRSSVYATLSESQSVLATASEQIMSKLSLPLSASAQYSRARTTSASLETPASSSIKEAASVVSSTRGPAVLKLTDPSVAHVADASSQASRISYNGNCSLVISTATSEAPIEHLCPHAGYNPVLSGQELPKTKGSERKPRKTSGGKMKSKPALGVEKLQADVRKAKSTLPRKYHQENEGNVYVKSTTTPLVSALLGHIDLSYALKFAERGESKVASLPQLWPGYERSEPAGESSSMNTPADTVSLSSAETTRMDLSTSVVSLDTSRLSSFKTNFIPFGVIEGHDREFSSSVAGKDMKEFVMSSSHSVLTAASTLSALSSEDPNLEKSSLATIKDVALLPHKPHSPMVSVMPTRDTAIATPLSSAAAEAVLVRESGSSTSPLQHQAASLAAASDSPTNHSVYTARTSTSMSAISSPSHSSLLSQISLSSSSVTNSDNSTFASSTAPLLSLSQPISSPPASSSSLSSPTVISLATSISSTKNDIVSYTVIGSTSVMESGSPHMIGSSHLPESPSVAIVQS